MRQNDPHWQAWRTKGDLHKVLIYSSTLLSDNGALTFFPPRILIYEFAVSAALLHTPHLKQSIHIKGAHGKGRHIPGEYAWECQTSLSIRHANTTGNYLTKRNLHIIIMPSQASKGFSLSLASAASPGLQTKASRHTQGYTHGTSHWFLALFLSLSLCND